MRKFVWGVTLIGVCACSQIHRETMEVDKALDYCAVQVNRTLEELKGDSCIGYTLMPRNIMDSLNTWHRVLVLRLTRVGRANPLFCYIPLVTGLQARK